MKVNDKDIENWKAISSERNIGRIVQRLEDPSTRSITRVSPKIDLRPYGFRITDKGINSNVEGHGYEWSRIRDAKAGPENRSLKASIHTRHSEFIANNMKVNNVVSTIGPHIREHAKMFKSNFPELKRIISYEKNKKTFMSQCAEKHNSRLILKKEDIFNAAFPTGISYIDLDIMSVLNDDLISNIHLMLKNNRENLENKFALSLCCVLTPCWGRRGYTSIERVVEVLNSDGWRVEKIFSSPKYRNFGARKEMAYYTLIINKQ